MRRDMSVNHTISLTIDIDPDGLSGKETNRAAISFHAFDTLRNCFEKMTDSIDSKVPLTWFVRADHQIEYAYHDPLHLFHHYEEFFNFVFNSLQHEVAWHPHLYDISKGEVRGLLLDETQLNVAVPELWKQVRQLPYGIRSFRNGEGWMTPFLFNLLERIGLETDSTVIANRKDEQMPQRNWEQVPHAFYYPDKENMKLRGAKRLLIEAPMSSWQFSMEYDAAPKFRYINPAVHVSVFQKGIEYLDSHWERHASPHWIFISHPDEIVRAERLDQMYGFSVETYAQNVRMFADFLLKKQMNVSFSTISEAVKLAKTKDENSVEGNE
jgi:hypothetical protein